MNKTFIQDLNQSINYTVVGDVTENVCEIQYTVAHSKNELMMVPLQSLPTEIAELCPQS
jgi:hypothetical protein